MKEVMQTALAILGSVGVGGAIVAALSSWLGKVWAERLMAKEAAKYREELERLTKQLERKNYVSKVRFDAEFAIYRDLSATLVEAVEKVGLLFPANKNILLSGSEFERQSRYNDLFIKASTALQLYKHCLYQNSAFISADIYSLFNDICIACNEQAYFFPQIFINEHKRVVAPEQEQKCWQTTGVLFKKRREVQEKLREYLKTLDVME